MNGMCLVCGLRSCSGCLPTVMTTGYATTYPPFVATTLEDEVDFAKDTLRAVLDYVRWSDMPQALADDVDAVLDGNVDDTRDDEDAD